MVGGLADWFAVVALFRHPLGMPIPHTAIIPERKAQFGETLGDFIQSSFLTPDAVAERVRRADVGGRVARWLADPANAERLAGHVADGAVQVADLLRDEDVQGALDGVVRSRLEATPLAPLAGRALRGAHPRRPPRRAGRRRARRGSPATSTSTATSCTTASSSQVAVVAPGRGRGPDLRAAPRRRPRRARRDGARPRPRPPPPPRRAHRRAGPRPPDLARAAGAGRPARPRPARPARAARVGQPACGPRSRPGPADPGRRPRVRARARAWPGRSPPAASGCSTSRRSPTWSRTAPSRRCATSSSTSATRSPSSSAPRSPRWDGEETAHRLELLLGPDLQFIRINGTVVGGLAGLVLHAIAQVLG